MTSHKKYLPKSGRFQVDETKVLDYLLSDKHPEGKSKAKFFSTHGFQRRDWQVLQDALVHHGQNRPVISTAKSAYGVKYVLECEIHTPNRSHPCIRSVWVSESDDTFRLVTAYPAA